jgi:DDE superfamily endonuclease
LTLAYLDECGFSPSQPVNCSWALPGQRKLIPYENPQGRRVNAIGVWLPFAEDPALWWDAVPRTLTAEDGLTIVEAIPRAAKPLVVVLDNASIHRSHVLQDTLPRLQEAGIHLYYLPPYSPELNRIEPLFGAIKYTELPERTYRTVSALLAAVDEAFTRYEQRRVAQILHDRRPAA